jgi:hypothetical protein
MFNLKLRNNEITKKGLEGKVENCLTIKILSYERIRANLAV